MLYVRVKLKTRRTFVGSTIRISLAYHYQFRNDDQGDPMAALESGRSGFEDHLKRWCRPAQNWVRFFVWDDSFESYLVARAIAAKHGLREGWVPYGRNEDFIIGGGGGTMEGPPR